MAFFFFLSVESDDGPNLYFFLLLQPFVDIATQHWPLSLSSATDCLGILFGAGLNALFAAVCLVKSMAHTWGMLKSTGLLLPVSGKAPTLPPNVELPPLQFKHTLSAFFLRENPTHFPQQNFTNTILLFPCQGWVGKEILNSVIF